jgi:hypothetical protein
MLLLLELAIFSTKSEVVLFFRRHLQPPVSIRIDGRLLLKLVSFKNLGKFFELRWELRLVNVQKRCLQRLNFLKSIAGVWWGSHPTSLHDYVV